MDKIKILPKLIFFKALGGYTAKESGKTIDEDCAKIEKELSNFLLRTNKVVTINQNHELVFVNRDEINKKGLIIF